MALLENGAQINTVMPSFVKNCSLEVGPLSDLVSRWVTCVLVWEMHFTKPLGYVVIQVQLDGVQGYDEDQIALVIPGLSHFAVWVPIILGTHMISCIINMIKEMEIDALAMPWVNAQVAHLLSVQRAPVTVEGDQVAGNSNLSWYNEVVITKNNQTIDAFSSHVIIAKAGTAHTSKRINVMTHALCIGDGSLH